MIKIECIDVKLPIKFKKRDLYIKVKSILAKEGKTAKNIFYYICSDSYLLELNNIHLNHNYFTDIITFDYTDEKFVNAEIYISIDRIIDNASKFKVHTESEFYRVCIHGILHCIGYNDKTKLDKELMTKKENEYLKLFSY